MTDTKAPETKKQEPEVEPKSESELAYEARSKAYSEGQEKVEAWRKERDAPYETLSNLVDEHAAAEKGETIEPEPKKK